MNETILVIDDHPLVREVVRSMLEASGYTTVVAPDGENAAALLADERIVGALVDVDMPGPNGVEVCRVLREAAATRGRSFFVWLMTGVMRPDVTEAAAIAGALGVLAKPFSTSDLLSRVAQIVALDKLSRAAA